MIPQPARDLMAAGMSEDALEEAVRGRCKRYGVTYVHHRRSKGTTPGWPDDALVGTRLLLRELKRQKGKVTAEQTAMIERLAAAGVDVDVWRPDDLLSGRIDRELAAIATRPAVVPR